MINKILPTFLLLLGLHASTLAQQSYPITFTHDGKTVYGTFTTPDGSGPFPTIIINQGSGPNDRDGTLPMAGATIACLYPELLGETLRPYKELANALVDSGYAVLRYDKLEFTYPPNSLGIITFHKIWLPVESAIDYVKTRSDVDTNRLILLGHSEGSSLISIIAKGRTDIKALISVAGNRTPFDSILAYQLLNIAHTCDDDTVTAQQTADAILNYFSDLRAGFCNGMPTFSGAPACVWADYTEATDSVVTNYNLNNLPTLFIGLGLDINVPPAELTRFQNEVTITDDFWLIPDLIHFMTPDDDPHVSMVLTDTIIYWLRQNNLATGISDANPINDFARVYPNPFDESFTVSISQSFMSASFSVYNVMGRRVFHHPNLDIHDSRTIDLSELEDGIYFLELNADGSRMFQRLVKK